MVTKRRVPIIDRTGPESEHKVVGSSEVDENNNILSYEITDPETIKKFQGDLRNVSIWPAGDNRRCANCPD